MERFLPNNWPGWIVHFFLMLVLWFLFAAKVEVGEFLVGVGGAALAATGDMAIRRGLFTRFRPKAIWLLQVWRLPGYVGSDTAVVFKVLFKRLALSKKTESVIRSVPFDPGGSGARSAARRALALIMTTVPPNSIAIGIDRRAKSMLVHQVEESDVAEVTKRLGAR